jgi:hypothetical protein
MKARAFSLLLCPVGLSEVRLFLRKSPVGSGCLVHTRSENAVGRDRPSAVSLWKMTARRSRAPVFPLVALAQDQIDIFGSIGPTRHFRRNSAEAAFLSCQELLFPFYA